VSSDSLTFIANRSFFLSTRINAMLTDVRWRNSRFITSRYF